MRTCHWLDDIAPEGLIADTAKLIRASSVLRAAEFDVKAYSRSICEPSRADNLETQVASYAAAHDGWKVDYADRMSIPNANRDKVQSQYEAMRIVYEGLSTIARERDMWVKTASQATKFRLVSLRPYLGLLQIFAGLLSETKEVLRGLSCLHWLVL